MGVLINDQAMVNITKERWGSKVRDYIDLEDKEHGETLKWKDHGELGL